MRNTLSPTKKQYFDGVSIGDRDIIQLIYDHYFHQIVKYIKKNSGDLENAKDVFQDALMTIYVKTKSEDLGELDCSFGTYLNAICRNLWLKKLRKTKTERFDRINGLERELQVEVIKAIEKRERWEFYREKFKELNKPCQKILKLFFEKYNFSEISKKLGFGSANYAKKKKYLCKEKLIDLMKKDNRFKEFNDK